MLCIILLFVSIPWALSGYSAIYSGEQLHDILAVSGTAKASQPAVLVLYEPSCYPPFDWMELDHHFLYLIHDYVTSRAHIWYRYRAEDDLQAQYMSSESSCLSAVYLKQNESLLSPAATWDSTSHITLKVWIARLLRKEITVTNKFYETVTVSQEAVVGGPEVPSMFIVPGQQGVVPTYLGYFMLFTRGDYVTILDSTVILSNTSSYTVTDKRKVPSDLLLENEMQHLEEKKTWVWNHAERHLRNMKQPLVVHNYTSSGYIKLHMPTELYMNLNRFYHEARTSHVQEEIIGNIIQGSVDQSPTMVYLNHYMMDLIESTLQPQMENWAGTKLKRTAIYGIREYYKGNRLFNHVDRVETHVISAILQIDQDLGGAEDWLLEVIDYKGERQHIKLFPGEMLFYESAKLIHGRPKPFKGNRFANAFVHFSPLADWDYRFEDKNFISTKHGILEPLDDLVTTLTASKNIFKTKDEL